MEALLLNLVVQLTPSLAVGIIFVTRLEGQLKLLSNEISYLRKEVDKSLVLAQQDLERLKEKLAGQERTVNKIIEFINVDRAAKNQSLFKISKYDLED